MRRKEVSYAICALLVVTIFTMGMPVIGDSDYNENENSLGVTLEFLDGPVRRLVASDKLYAYVGFDHIYTYEDGKKIQDIEFYSGWSPAYGLSYCSVTNKLYIRGQPTIAEIDLINGSYRNVGASPPWSRDGIFAVSYDGLNFFDGETGPGYGGITGYDLSPANWGQETRYNLNFTLSALTVTPDNLYVICVGRERTGIDPLFILDRNDLHEIERIEYPGYSASKVIVTGNSRFAVALEDSQAHIFNLQTRTYQGHINFTCLARDITASNDMVYVTGGNTIYEINPNTMTVLRELSINGAPSEVAISSDFKILYVVDAGRNKVVALNIQEEIVEYEIVDFGPAGRDVGVTFDSKYAIMPNGLVSCSDAGFFGVVNIEQGTSEAVPMPVISNYIAIKPNSYEFAFYNSKSIYENGSEYNELYFMDLETEVLRGPFLISGKLCGDLTYGPNGRYLFVGKSPQDYTPLRPVNYSVVIYDTLINSISEISIRGFPSCLRVNQDFTRLYAAFSISSIHFGSSNEPIGGIAEIDLSTNSLIKTTFLYSNQQFGDHVYSMEIDPERKIAFVEFWGEGTKVVNLTSGEIVSIIEHRVGRPFAFNADRSSLWVGSYGTGASYWNPPLYRIENVNYSFVQSIDIPGIRTLGLAVYSHGLVVTTFGETIIVRFITPNQQPTTNKSIDPPTQENDEIVDEFYSIPNDSLELDNLHNNGIEDAIDVIPNTSSELQKNENDNSADNLDAYSINPKNEGKEKSKTDYFAFVILISILSLFFTIFIIQIIKMKLL